MAPACTRPESKDLSDAVTVCGIRSVFFHTMVSQSLTITEGGLNFIPSRRTVCVVCAREERRVAHSASRKRREMAVSLPFVAMTLLLANSL